MGLTRRRFLECAAGSALAMAVLPRAPRFRNPRRSPAAWSTECAILDLEKDCGIRESIAGYERAIAQLEHRAVHIDARSAPVCAALIVPAALKISSATGRVIRSSLARGTTVIVESGAAFADTDSADFAAHRHSLRAELQVDVGMPLSLWPRRRSAGGIPYVDYRWPAATRVRDFSRVVPLSSPEPRDAIIGRVDDVAVALMRRSGSGTLVFLGSPLGPALRCGDAEARQWLSGVLASAVGRR